MSRLLKKLRVRLGRPKPFVECPWDKARKQRRLRRIRRLVRDAGPDEVVVYVNEVDIHLNPKIGPDWMLRGQQKEVLTPGQNQKLPGRGPGRAHGATHLGAGSRKTSLLFLDLLYELATRTYRTARRIHVILDNYGIHDSLQVRLALATEQGRA